MPASLIGLVGDQEMARIVLSTIGVRGDLNPFIAIGRGLRARGHDVLFAVEPALQTAVADEGFEFKPLPGDVLGDLSPHITSIVRGRTPIASVAPIVRDWLTRGLAAKVEALTATCDGADLLIARAAHLSAPIAAQRLGIPWVQVTMSALTVPSVHTDPHLIPLSSIGPRPRVVNRLSWAATDFVARRLADERVNSVRRRYGLPRSRSVMGRGGHSPHLTAVAVSPTVSPARPDWPRYVATTGYCFWDVPSGWREPPELTSFLDREPAVAISFGSIAPFVGGALSHLYESAVDAVLAAGAKALVIGGPPGGLAAGASGRVLAVPFAPFSLVYPRCVAAIHHGGPYTVGEALRAGLPSLAVPWGIDQFFTAEELKRTGAGMVRHHRRFRGRRARRDVTALLGVATYRHQAAVLAGCLAREDGVETLCLAVETVLQRRHELSRT